MSPKHVDVLDRVPAPSESNIDAGGCAWRSPSQLVEPNRRSEDRVALVCMKGEVTVKIWREIGDQIFISTTNADPNYKELVVPTEECSDRHS